MNTYTSYDDGKTHACTMVMLPIDGLRRASHYYLRWKVKNARTCRLQWASRLADREMAVRFCKKWRIQIPDSSNPGDNDYWRRKGNPQ